MHFLRNVLGKVKRKDRDRMAMLLKQITNAPTLAEAKEALRRAVGQLEERYPGVARMLQEEGEEWLARRYLRMELEEIEEAIMASLAEECFSSVLDAPGSHSAPSTLNLEM